MPEFLLNLDNNITLALNGSNSLYADGIMLQATSTLTWIPVGVILIYVIVKNNEFPKLLTTIAMLVACVAICTTLSEISKALFERWRPCNDPFIMHAVKTVNGYREAKFRPFGKHHVNSRFPVIAFQEAPRHSVHPYMVCSERMVADISRRTLFRRCHNRVRGRSNSWRNSLHCLYKNFLAHFPVATCHIVRIHTRRLSHSRC